MEKNNSIVRIEQSEEKQIESSESEDQSIKEKTNHGVDTNESTVISTRSHSPLRKPPGEFVYTKEEMLAIRDTLKDHSRPETLEPIYCTNESGYNFTLENNENRQKYHSREMKDRSKGYRNEREKKSHIGSWKSDNSESDFSKRFRKPVDSSSLKEKQQNDEDSESLVLSPPHKVFPSSQSSPVSQRRNQSNTSKELQFNKERDSEFRKPFNRFSGEKLYGQPIKRSNYPKERETTENFNGPHQGGRPLMRYQQRKSDNNSQDQSSSPKKNMNYIDSLFALDNQQLQDPLAWEPEEEKPKDDVSSRGFSRWFGNSQSVSVENQDKESTDASKPSIEFSENINEKNQEKEPNILTSLFARATIEDKKINSATTSQKQVESILEQQSPASPPFPIPQQQVIEESALFIQSLMSTTSSQERKLTSHQQYPQKSSLPHSLFQNHHLNSHPKPPHPNSPVPSNSDVRFMNEQDLHQQYDSSSHRLPPMPPNTFLFNNGTPINPQMMMQHSRYPPHFIPSSSPVPFSMNQMKQQPNTRSQNLTVPNNSGLEKWFGDTIYQVSALPPMPPNVKMVSLEEVEKPFSPEQ